MKWRTVVLAVAAIITLVMGGCAHTTINPTQQKYIASWKARLEQYKKEFVERDQIIRNLDRESSKTISTAPKNERWPLLVSNVARAGSGIREAYKVAGRGETIKAFVSHVKTNPTPGLTDAWFMRHVEDTKQRAATVDATTKDFQKGFDQKIRRGSEWILEAEAIFKAQGMIEGTIEELKALQSEAVAYYVDMRIAEADAQRRAERAQAALLGLGLYFNQLDYQQQMLNTLNRPRTCSFVGNSMTCY